MIHLENITKSFGNLQVLRGIDLEIEKGEIVSIVGPSGAGKTTLLQIMGTLDMPDGGSVVIDGTQVNRMRERELSAFRNHHIGLPNGPPTSRMSCREERSSVWRWPVLSSIIQQWCWQMNLPAAWIPIIRKNCTSSFLIYVTVSDKRLLS